MRPAILKYAARFDLDRESGFYTVTFPDLPDAITQGETRDEAMEMAEDVLLLVVRERMRLGEDLPRPSKPRGRTVRDVSLPAPQAARAVLYMAMRAAGINSGDLARRLGKAEPAVARLFDLRRPARLEDIEAAFRALGKRLILGIENAA